MKELVTSRLTVRAIRAEDWRSIQEIWEDVKKTGYHIYDIPKDTGDNAMRERISRWAEATENGSGHVFCAVCLKREVIGFIAFNAIEEGYEIGYGFLNRYQGKGYAKESMTAAFEYMKETGAKKITAGTALKNLPSAALLKSLGFKLMRTENISFYKDADGKDIFFEGGMFEKIL